MRQFSFTSDTTIAEMATAFAARPFDAFGLHAELDFTDPKVRAALSLAAQQKPRDAYEAIRCSGVTMANEQQRSVLHDILHELCSNPQTAPVMADIVSQKTELTVESIAQLGKTIAAMREKSGASVHAPTTTVTNPQPAAKEYKGPPAGTRSASY